MAVHKLHRREVTLKRKKNQIWCDGVSSFFRALCWLLTLLDPPPIRLYFVSSKLRYTPVPASGLGVDLASPPASPSSHGLVRGVRGQPSSRVAVAAAAAKRWSKPCTRRGRKAQAASAFRISRALRDTEGGLHRSWSRLKYACLNARSSIHNKH